MAAKITKAEADKIKEAEALKEAKQYKVKFDSDVMFEFIDHGKHVEKDKQGQEFTVDDLPAPFVIKRGQTKIIDQKMYDYLKSRNVLISAFERAEQERLRGKYLRRKSVRSEPKRDVQTWTDDVNTVIFTDLPYELEE